MPAVRIAVEENASGTGREVRVDLPEGTRDARIRVHLDGSPVHEASTNRLRWETNDPGPLRVEIDRSVRLVRRRWLPWILTGSLGDARLDVQSETETSGEH